jgi:hypothetical protein
MKCKMFVINHMSYYLLRRFFCGCITDHCGKCRIHFIIQ